MKQEELVKLAGEAGFSSGVWCTGRRACAGRAASLRVVMVSSASLTRRV